MRFSRVGLLAEVVIASCKSKWAESRILRHLLFRRWPSLVGKLEYCLVCSLIFTWGLPGKRKQTMNESNAVIIRKT